MKMDFDKEIKIGNKIISEKGPTFIIAEIGLNHNGSVELAKRMIDEAKECNVDAVKFQLRDNKDLFTKEAYNSPYNKWYAYGKTYGEHREALELTYKDYKFLKKYSEDKGLIFFASPWDKNSADFLSEINTSVFKIASPDLNNLPLVEHIAKLNKPIILSTGMSEQKEIDETVELIHKYNKKLVLLQCNSSYPSTPEEIDINVIKTLKEKYNCIVGYSGHETGLAISLAAVAVGARVIERHFTLDRAMKGPDHSASIEPQGMKKLSRDIRIIEKVMKDGTKKLNESEIPIKQKLSKSVISTKTIPEGTTITQEMLAIKCPGTGLPPKYIKLLIDKKTKKEIKEDTVITEDMVDI